MLLFVCQQHKDNVSVFLFLNGQKYNEHFIRLFSLVTEKLTVSSHTQNVTHKSHDSV